MNVVFVASELSPFASTGGLGDCAAGLSKALSEAGHAVIRVLPMYRRIVSGEVTSVDTGIRLRIPVGFKTYTAEVAKSTEGAPETYFIGRDEFFDRSHLYNTSSRDYEDNFERFVFFQKAVVALIDHLKLPVDIVHLNDWQTGLIPYFLDHGIHGGSRGRREKVVFTIHNLAYQGLFPGSDYGMTSLPFNCFSVDTLEYYGQINCAKAGITGANWITTVSPQYASEIQQKDGGFGLEGLLLNCRNRMSGILNGVDTTVWDPSTDRAIAANFNAVDTSGRRQCRAALLRRAGLSIRDDVPVLGMVTRLVAMKGIDLLEASMDRLIETGVAFVILGAGEAAHMAVCRGWASRWPGRISYTPEYTPDLARVILAGSDMVLIPSRREPCGLTQFYGLRYGAIPIVHATGGLKDSVHDFGATAGEGNGFVFEDYTVDALASTLQRAVDVYHRRADWIGLMRRAMSGDYSWSRPAREYTAIYQKIRS